MQTEPTVVQPAMVAWTTSTPKMSEIFLTVRGSASGVTIAPLSLTRMLFPAAFISSGRRSTGSLAARGAISSSSAMLDIAIPFEFRATRDPTTRAPPAVMVTVSTPSASVRSLRKDGSEPLEAMARLSEALA